MSRPQPKSESDEKPPRPLYDKARADSLREREAAPPPQDHEKFTLLLENLGRPRRLVDIGCGGGQFLRVASECTDELWGVDESPDRIKDAEQTCPKAKFVICRVEQLQLPDAYFDVAVTSQMLHEVKLFRTDAELQATLHQIHRILADGGRYFLLDHRDAGEGDVAVRLPREKTDQLLQFEQRFKYYKAKHQDVKDGVIKISRRHLQDFLTKTWALGSPMESMEMNETHNVFEQRETSRLVQTAGFAIDKWIDFSDIRQDLKLAGGELLTGRPWFRKFLLISTKAKRLAELPWQMSAKRKHRAF